MWLVYALLSALFAGITSILAKCGIRKTDTNVATAIRTIVVLAFAWLMVLVVGSGEQISSTNARSLLFLCLSGLATGASWLCYFRALQLGDVNKVVPIDKSSTILTVLMAIVIFRETDRLVIKLIGVTLLAVGTFLMIEKKQAGAMKNNRGWLLYAILSAVFAALTTVLAKIGVDGVESNLATAIRTTVVLAMAWIVVFATGKQAEVAQIPQRELLFICLSGLATGASWLCYYCALQNGPASAVVSIDKLSIVITVAFACFILGEKPSRRSVLGLLLIIVGTLSIALL